MDETLNLALLAGCSALIVAVLLARLATRTGLPVLLLYLGLGLLLGNRGIGISFDDYKLTENLGLILLAVILAEGGLTTRWSVIRPVLPYAAVLATVGVGISIGIVAGMSAWLLGVDGRTAVLLGGVVSSTDAAAVFSVLRKLQLRERLRSVLEAESGLNDAPVVVLVVLVSSDSWDHLNLWHAGGELVYELVAGAVIGLVLGRLGVELLSRAALPAAGLYPLATVGLALLAFTTSNAAHASGFLAVYIAGLVLGNAKLPHRRAVLGFASSVSLLAEAALFVLLGLLVDPGRLPEALVDALVVGAAATFLARPVAVWISALPFRIPLREQVFISWAGLRGAVPIVVATIPVTHGLDGSERILDVVFVLVVIYTLVQAPTLPALGRFLKVVDAHQPFDLEVESAPLEAMNADLLQFSVPADSALRGVYLPELRLPRGAQITLIVRGTESLVPDRDTQLRAHDTLLVVTTHQVREETEQRLRAVARGGKLARWYDG